MHNTRYRRKHGGLGVVAKVAWCIVGAAAIAMIVLLLLPAVNNQFGENVDISMHNTYAPTVTDGPGGIIATNQPRTDAPFVGTQDPNIPTAEPTSAPSESPSANPISTPDYSVFDNCVFVGNSVFEGLYRYGIITHGTFFTKVGLNILSVYTDTSTNGTLPIMSLDSECELDSGNYDAVILMFGQNELGWPSVDSFINHYERFIDDVRAKQPDASIFLMGLPPFTKAKSDGESDGANNERIHLYNTRIEELAGEKNCFFISVPDSMKTPDGDLPDDASSDGMHLNMKYSRLWADHICSTVAAVITQR